MYKAEYCLNTSHGISLSLIYPDKHVVSRIIWSDDGDKNLYLENPSDYLLLSRQTSTCTSGGEPSSDYQTHVFDTSASIISNSTSERFMNAPAFCPRASRELSGHRNIFSLFGQQMPSGKFISSA